MWFSPILLACEDTLGCEDHKYLDRKPRATWRIGGLETRPAGCSPLWQAGWAITLAEQMGHLLEQGRDSELPYDTATRQVVGFVTAMGDGALGAFIPLLEALPEYRDRGIGAELMRLALARPGDRYSIDLVCDPDLVPFYERLRGAPATAMMCATAMP
jgi:ribosomal protein S18 acetylase RimI-like enzyme